MNFIEEVITSYKDKITGIIQVGANDGRELSLFIDNGITTLALFEPQWDIFQILAQRVSKIDNNKDIAVINKALGDCTCYLGMYKADNGSRSSSILPPKLHTDLWPDIHFNKDDERMHQIPLDTWLYNAPLYKTCNMLFMDTQGYELKVLDGARDSIDQFDYILTEISTDELYEGCALLDDIDNFLLDYNFKRVSEDIWDGKFHGNALYVR